jgi:transposase
MQGSKCYQPRIFYQVSLEQLVPQDHLVRQLAKVLDLGWVRHATCNCYSYTGRPSIDPVVIAKMFVLCFLYNIGSERQLMRDIRVNLAYRWYLGYDLDEAIPDHSVLSKARRRLGTEFFEKIFSFVLRGCREAGLVDGSNLLIDSTGMSANASESSITALRYTPKQYWQQLEATSQDSNDGDGHSLGQDRPRAERLRDIKRSSTDPDATLFRRGGASVLGYKAHIGADAQSGVITAVGVTTGSEDDTSAVPDIVEQHRENIGQPATVVADGQYGSQQCLEYLQQRDIETVIKQRSGGNKHGKFPKEAFRYESDSDVYICPCGKMMRRFRTDGSSRKAYYRCEKSSCSLCQLRGQCIGSNASSRTVTRYDTPYSDRAMQACNSCRGRRLLRLRQTCIEGLFGQAKSLHGMARARWRGLKKVLMQVLLTAIVLNIKKLLADVARRAKKAVISVKSANFLFYGVYDWCFVFGRCLLSTSRVCRDRMFFKYNQKAWVLLLASSIFGNRPLRRNDKM